MRLVTGRETPEHFLTRALPSYEAVQYVNRTAKPGQKVLGVFVEQVRFYLNPRLDTGYCMVREPAAK